MNSKILANGILRAVGILVGISIFLWFLYQISAVLIYIALAAIISLIGRPIVLLLREKLKFKNLFAVITTMLLLVGVFVGVMAMFIPLVVEQGENLSLLNIEALQGNLETLYAHVNTYLSNNNIDLLKTVEDFDLPSKINFNAIPDLLNSIFGAFGSFSIGLFSVVFISFFFLKDSAMFSRGLMVLVSDKQEVRLKDSIVKIRSLLTRYFIGLVVQITILFVLYTVILLIFGIENAVVIAFLCALLNLIPYIGPLIGGVLMFVLSMSSNLGLDFQAVILPTTIKVMVGYLIAQLVDNFVSQPFIFSNSVKSHPLEIFLVIIIGGLLFGVIGMIVAVPAYTVVKVIAKEFLSEYKVVKKLTKNL